MTRNQRSTSSSASLAAGGFTSMSTRRQSGSSTSIRSARRSKLARRQIPSTRDQSSGRFNPEILVSPSSSSLKELYESEQFSLAWDNDVTFHVAENSTRLRKLRRLSQAAVAKRMGTSQSAVARIEGGDDIRLSTLGRLASALGGRIRFAMEPSEANLAGVRNSLHRPRHCVI